MPLRHIAAHLTGVQRVPRHKIRSRCPLPRPSEVSNTHEHTRAQGPPPPTARICRHCVLIVTLAHSASLPTVFNWHAPLRHSLPHLCAIMYALSLIAAVSSIVLAPVLGAVTWDATPFNPASVPLAVRTPYVSAWLAQGSGTALNDAWPTFWTGSVSSSSRKCFLYSSDVIDPWLGRVCQG